MPMLRCDSDACSSYDNDNDNDNNDKTDNARNYCNDDNAIVVVAMLNQLQFGL